MKTTSARVLLALVAAALVTAGCGGSGNSNAPSSATAAAPSSTAAPQLTDQQAPPSRLVIDVTIAGGQVTPTNAALQAKVGEPIVVRVNSDAADQLHVHSTPEYEFTVEPKQVQSFQFTVDVPGKVDVELHGLDKTVATITVQ